MPQEVKAERLGIVARFAREHALPIRPSLIQTQATETRYRMSLKR
jgi:hypothetical protein